MKARHHLTGTFKPGHRRCFLQPLYKSEGGSGSVPSVSFYSPHPELLTRKQYQFKELTAPRISGLKTRVEVPDLAKP